MILAASALFICNLVRPLAFRPLAVGRRAGDSCTIIACFMLVGSILMLPVLYPMLQAAKPAIIAQPWLLAVGFVKGLILWLIIWLDQYLRKQSNSSSTFKGFPALAVMALINVYFLGEILTFWQWAAVIALSALGLGFIWRGHLSTLTRQYKGIFVLLVFVCALPACTDLIVIAKTNWYVQFIMSSLGLMTIVLLNKRSRNLITEAFIKRDCFIMGSVFLVTEIIILYLLVTHISITMGALSSRLAIPSVMLISSLLYQEGKWQSQLLFGLLAYLAILPIILF